MSYYNSLAISQSDIKLYLESPEVFYQVKFNNGARESTDELTFGSLVDDLIFESQVVFNEKYYIIPKDQETRKNTTIGKEFWKKIETEQIGKTIVTYDDFKKADEMKKTLNLNPIARYLLFSENVDFAFNQLEINWKSSVSKLDLKSKLDRVIKVDNKITIIDYKTTASNNAYGFRYSVKKYGYHIQESFYREAIKEHFQSMGFYDPSVDEIEFVFLAQYKKFPYHVLPVILSDDDVARGYKTWTEALQKLEFSIDTNMWSQPELSPDSSDGFIKLKCFDDRYDD